MDRLIKLAAVVLLLALSAESLLRSAERLRDMQRLARLEEETRYRPHVPPSR